MNDIQVSIGGMIVTAENPKYLENNPSQCHFVHCKYHKAPPRIEPGLQL
jgi:hypothetical protein